MTSKIEHPMLKQQPQSVTKPAGAPTKPLIPFVKVVEDAETPSAPPVGDPAALFDEPVMRLEAEKKRTLEKLVLFKKPITKEVKIDDVTFKFKILNSNDSAEVFGMLAGMPESEQQAKINLLLLAASLTEANGLPIESVYEGPPVAPLMKRLSELARWNAPLVNALSREYRKFVDEEDKRYSADFLG